MSIGSRWSGRTHYMMFFGEKKLAILTLSDPIPTNCCGLANPIIKEPARKNNPARC